MILVGSFQLRIVYDPFILGRQGSCPGNIALVSPTTESLSVRGTQLSQQRIFPCHLVSKYVFLPELKTQRMSLGVLVVHYPPFGYVNCTRRNCLTSNAKSSDAPWGTLIDPVSCKSFCLFLSPPDYNHLAHFDRALGSTFSSPGVTCICSPEEVGKNMTHAETSDLKTIVWHLSGWKYILEMTALA